MPPYPLKYFVLRFHSEPAIAPSVWMTGSALPRFFCKICSVLVPVAQKAFSFFPFFCFICATDHAVLNLSRGETSDRPCTVAAPIYGMLENRLAPELRCSAPVCAFSPHEQIIWPPWVILCDDLFNVCTLSGCEAQSHRLGRFYRSTFFAPTFIPNSAARCGRREATGSRPAVRSAADLTPLATTNFCHEERRLPRNH